MITKIEPDRADGTAARKCGNCEREFTPTAFGQGWCDDCNKAKRAAEAPLPPSLPTCPNCIIETYFDHRPARILFCPLHASAAVLRDALIGFSIRNNPKDAACPYCWCDAWDWTKHTPKCAAARAALRDSKGEK